MNKFLLAVFVVLLAGSGFGQKPRRTTAVRPSSAKRMAAAPKPTPAQVVTDPALEKAKFDGALALTSAADKVSALKKFIDDFPGSEHKAKALESLVTARAILGDEKLQANEDSEGVALFKLAVDEAPTPIPDRLFNEIVAKFPANLFYRGQRASALGIAEAIEKRSAGNAKQLLSLAAFYLGIESGADAKRLAEAAIAIDPNSVTAYQTLGLANRLSFDLDESARSYSKALELELKSVESKRGLAEMKRALGKPEEAAALYSEIVAVNENDPAARTGLILSLFDAGKRTEAESEMTKSLEQNPKNLSLLAGAAYWYAANDSGEKAVEFAQKAVELEPRFIWGHIALARGLMSEKKPVDAERVLVAARQFGNFPTLEYEIASARLMAGFYREAIEELQKSFSIKDGLIQTKLGGRVFREEKNFTDLVAYERRASIFEPMAADNPKNAAKLKLLFELTQKLAADAPDETELAALADEFVKGDDKMKLHRQMYSATLLLQRNAALPKVLELVKSAVGNADAGLDVATPAAAVMASELYESRTIAFARNEMIVIPDVPRQTLSAILRGRIEELTGWTLYQQKSYPEAVVRLRRAISVLPDKSAWWRSSMWRLGAALEADGKDKEALSSYIQSYKTDRPSPLKYAIIDTLYKKVQGSSEGLEAKIGPNPLPGAAAKAPESIAKPSEPSPTITEPAAQPVKSIEKIFTPETSVKAIEKIEPKADEPLTLDKHVETKTEASPLPAKITDPPKVENPLKAGEPRDTKTQVPEPPVKTPVIAEPKAENVSTPDKQLDTKPPPSETTAKTIETSQPMVTALEKPTDLKTPPVEIPAKTVDEGKPAAENANPPIINKEIKNDPSEPQKIETASTIPPVVEPVVKTESNPPADASNGKAAEKAETMPPPQTNSEIPLKTEPSRDEPKKLLHDPLPDAETKTGKSAEKPIDPQAAIKTETAAAKKLSVVIDDPLGNGKKTANIRELFEPVIIKVPSSSSQKPAKNETEQPPPDTSKNHVDDAVSSGASRVRVVDGKEISTDTKCTFEFSQDNISLINGRGSLGILVSIVGEGDFKDVAVSSSSPKDIEVKAQPEIAGIPGRRFYIIKSISTAVGVYQVSFESHCEKKELIVRVR